MKPQAVIAAFGAFIDGRLDDAADILRFIEGSERRAGRTTIADQIRLMLARYGTATGEVERLEAERTRLLSAAVDLIARPERHGYGPDPSYTRMGYYLDGEWAGPTIEDLVLKAAEKAGGG
jgi:hypothetical protein